MGFYIGFVFFNTRYAIDWNLGHMRYCCGCTAFLTKHAAMWIIFLCYFLSAAAQTYDQFPDAVG